MKQIRECLVVLKPVGGHICDVLGVRNLGEGFTGVAVQAVRGCVQMLVLYLLDQDRHEGPPRAHPRGIHCPHYSSAVSMEPKMTPADKIIDRCSPCKQSSWEGPTELGVWVRLRISLGIEKTYTWGRVQCSAIFKSARQPHNHPYEVTGF